jgi:hypothetical protein
MTTERFGYPSNVLPGALNPRPGMGIWIESLVLPSTFPGRHKNAVRSASLFLVPTVSKALAFEASRPSSQRLSIRRRGVRVRQSIPN